MKIADGKALEWLEIGISDSESFRQAVETGRFGIKPFLTGACDLDQNDGISGLCARDDSFGPVALNAIVGFGAERVPASPWDANAPW